MSQEGPEIHVPDSRTFKSGTPRMEEMLVYPRTYETGNKKGRELPTEDQAGTQAHSHIKKKKNFYWTFQEEFIPCLVNLELWARLGPQTGDYGNLERKYQAISVTRTFRVENNSVSLYL